MNDWRNDPVTERQKELLKELGLPVPATKRGASELLDAYFDQPTPKQIAMLKHMGLETPSTREEASDLITAHIDKPTPKQIAKLEYMGRKVPRTKERASEILDQIEEDPKYEKKRISWDIKKYDLHPNLYFETEEEITRYAAKESTHLQPTQKPKENNAFRLSDKKGDLRLVGILFIIIPAVFAIFAGALGGSRFCAFLSILLILGIIFYFWKKAQKVRDRSAKPPPLPHNDLTSPAIKISQPLQQIKKSSQWNKDLISGCVLIMVLALFVGTLYKNTLCTNLFISSVILSAGITFCHWGKALCRIISYFWSHVWRKKKKAPELLSEPPPLPPTES